MKSGKFVTTVGYERRFNHAFQITDREQFVAFMTTDQPPRPANIANIVAINQGARPLTMNEPIPKPLSPARVREILANGSLVVDTRSEAAFGSGHIPGAFNIQLSSAEFEQRVGWVTPVDVPLVLVFENDADADRALHLLAFLGLDARVEGYLAGGMRAWMRKGGELRTLPQHDVREVHRTLEESGLHVLDVRETDEWQSGHIENARHLSYKLLSAELDRLALDRREPVAVVCAGGLRSSTACSILLRNGFEKVRNVTGGMGAWAAAGLPMREESA